MLNVFFKKFYILGLISISFFYAQNSYAMTDTEFGTNTKSILNTISEKDKLVNFQQRLISIENKVNKKLVNRYKMLLTIVGDRINELTNEKKSETFQNYDTLLSDGKLSMLNKSKIDEIVKELYDSTDASYSWGGSDRVKFEFNGVKYKGGKKSTKNENFKGMLTDEFINITSQVNFNNLYKSNELVDLLGSKDNVVNMINGYINSDKYNYTNNFNGNVIDNSIGLSLLLHSYGSTSPNMGLLYFNENGNLKKNVVFEGDIFTIGTKSGGNINLSVNYINKTINSNSSMIIKDKITGKIFQQGKSISTTEMKNFINNPLEITYNGEILTQSDIITEGSIKNYYSKIVGGIM